MKLLLVLAALALIAFVLLKKGKASSASADEEERSSPQEQPQKRKSPLTEREQAMHNRLTQALPGLVVLAQVSFGALLYAKSRGARNRFDRKIADFVVCNKAYQVLAVIELDDSSHRGKEEQDAARDEMLEKAGYRVIRYPNIPDIDAVQADFAAALAP